MDFKIVEVIERVPDIYLKQLKNTSGLYEIRLQVESNIFRIFYFFSFDNLVVLGYGFQKKILMKTKNQILKSLDQFINENMGVVGAKNREEFNTEYDAFKIGVLIQQAREYKGLTQEQFANLAGTNKSYISKLERNLKDIRFSTLQRIINEGLGGYLDISIRLE